MVIRRCLTLFIICYLNSLMLAPTCSANGELFDKGLADPLPSWKEGLTKASIISFVANSTNESHPDYVAPEERIAVMHAVEVLPRDGLEVRDGDALTEALAPIGHDQRGLAGAGGRGVHDHGLFGAVEDLHAGSFLFEGHCRRAEPHRMRFPPTVFGRGHGPLLRGPGCVPDLRDGHGVACAGTLRLPVAGAPS